MLKNDKLPGVDNIPDEVLKRGGPGIIDAFTVVCQKIWTSGQWPKNWTQSLIIPHNTRLCQEYSTISLITHPCKVMLRVILNRLVNKAEQTLEEEQAGLRSHMSSAEQIYSTYGCRKKFLSQNFCFRQCPYSIFWKPVLQLGVLTVNSRYLMRPNLVGVVRVHGQSAALPKSILWLELLAFERSDGKPEDIVLTVHPTMLLTRRRLLSIFKVNRRRRTCF